MHDRRVDGRRVADDVHGAGERVAALAQHERAGVRAARVAHRGDDGEGAEDAEGERVQREALVPPRLTDDPSDQDAEHAGGDAEDISDVAGFADGERVGDLEEGGEVGVVAAVGFVSLAWAWGEVSG